MEEKKEEKKTAYNYYATGRRKTSTARVWIKPGSGQISVNGKTSKEYFGGRLMLHSVINEPFVATNNANKYDVKITVNGGGHNGQAGAIRHGVSKILAGLDPAFKLVLRKAGMITRDSREKERKKYGQPGARKRFQFSKR